MRMTRLIGNVMPTVHESIQKKDGRVDGLGVNLWCGQL